MYIRIHDELREVIIIKKRTTKNTYMRVKEDGKIYVTTNSLITNKKIISILETHIKQLTSMADIQEKKKAYQEKFFYLGKEYRIILTNDKDVYIGTDKVFLGRTVDLTKWYKKQAEMLFQERLDYYYKCFSRKIPYPKLKIRTMKSRWGVCNTKEKTVTLNLELMKKKIVYLDYVVVHELSHLVVANHSESFWKVVEENYPNYKKIRKEIKDYE